jgi:ribosomal protein S18 acetylase RimI-like enzyme
MLELTVRLARPEDDPQIGEILVDSFVATYARKMPEVVVHDARKSELRAVARKRDEQALILVAEHNHKVIGTVSLFKPGVPSSEAWLPNMADLRHLAVDPAFQGKGVAKPLLDEAERIARVEWRIDGISLHVRRGAFGVARLYTGRGYVRDPSGDFEKPGVFLEAYVLRFRPASE